ncbi:hypothetical protein EIK77_001449 [Talaromyces pinophilus]|nr:hypothetical protein EIK77_001449 [Talaromyces pinophilus]
MEPFVASSITSWDTVGSLLLIGGVAGLLLCITYRFIGQIFNLSGDTEDERPKVKRSYSADVTPERDEYSDSTASEARRESKLRHQLPDSKHDNRFTLSEFYADWMDRDDLIPSKEPGIISSTIIEEDDDNQEAWE